MIYVRASFDSLVLLIRVFLTSRKYDFYITFLCKFASDKKSWPYVVTVMWLHSMNSLRFITILNRL